MKTINFIEVTAKEIYKKWIECNSNTLADYWGEDTATLNVQNSNMMEVCHALQQANKERIRNEFRGGGTPLLLDERNFNLIQFSQIKLGLIIDLMNGDFLVLFPEDLKY